MFSDSISNLLAFERVEWVRSTGFLEEKISYRFAYLEKFALIFQVTLSKRFRKNMPARFLPGFGRS